MLTIRTEACSMEPSEEFIINFEAKTIITGGKKYHMVKIEELGIGYTFVALAYDTYAGKNLYLTSLNKVRTMTE